MNSNQWSDPRNGGRPFKRKKNNELQSRGEKDPPPRSSDRVVDVLSEEDQQLVLEFSDTHPGFFLPGGTHNPSVRLSAYVHFVIFLKFMRSKTTLELLTTSKLSVSIQLNHLKTFGFRGQWFDDLENKLNILNQKYFGIGDTDLQELSKLEARRSQDNAALENEIRKLSGRLGELNGQLITGYETLADLSAKKQRVMNDRDVLNVPFRF